ncbi:MAG: RagB/SusD family nutrient uptake outer membrane protein [Prevotella sp.]|nr:RagB/SusD family nutrient uptake outer membrane protein [Prevotella sp.]
MKKVLAVLLLVSGVVLSTSCSDDFLNVPPKDRYSDAAVWNDESLASAFVNNIYEGQYYGLHDVIFSAIDDQAMEVWQWESQPVVNNGISPSYLGILGHNFWIYSFGTLTWQSLYKSIRNCNIFLQRTKESGFESDEMTRLTGEVHFMRGYFYSWLMSFYGGVPIVEKAYTPEDEDMLVSRNTLAETIDYIVADLDSAAALLPVSGDKARATKGAALALKARVLLYAASDLFNSRCSWQPGYANVELVSYTDGDRRVRWQKARDAAKAVMDLGVYHVVGEGGFSSAEAAIKNYEDMFFNHGTDEDIMLTYYDNVNTHSDWQTPAFAKTQSPNGFYGWGGNVPTQQMVDSYEMADGTKFSWENPEHAANPYANRDPRFYATILYDGAYWKERPGGIKDAEPTGCVQTGYYENADGSWSPGYDTRNSPIYDWNGTYTGYYMRKWVDPSVDQMFEYEMWPYRQIRYTEVLLNYAECCIELGDEAEARRVMNIFRKRAYMPLFDSSLSGAALKQEYRDERNIELAFEQNRFFDIRRWMIAPDVIKTAKGIDIRYHYGQDKPTYTFKDVQERQWDNKNYLLPIILSEMQKNENLIQNPGY